MHVQPSLFSPKIRRKVFRLSNKISDNESNIERNISKQAGLFAKFFSLF